MIDYDLEGVTAYFYENPIQGVSGYFLPESLAGSVALFRLSLAGQGHLYTTSEDARDSAINDGWSYDGVVGHVFPAQ